jgi:hypothetical protein
MAELRPIKLGCGLTVAALLLLIMPGTAQAGDPGCTKGKITLQEICSHKGQMALQVPSNWDCEVREFTDGLVVDDRGGKCTLEFLRSPGVMAATDAARLYEALYLGENKLEKGCAGEISRKVTWGDERVFGEYRPRAKGRTVQALYAVAGGEVFVALLKCNLATDEKADWALATAIFNSYRKPPTRSHKWRAKGGLLGPLYFFVKIPLNQFQNPD